MTSLAWSDVAIMAGCSLAFVVLLAVVETASQALKRRRHAREDPRWRHICSVCHTTGCPHYSS